MSLCSWASLPAKAISSLVHLEYPVCIHINTNKAFWTSKDPLLHQGLPRVGSPDCKEPRVNLPEKSSLPDPQHFKHSHRTKPDSAPSWARLSPSGLVHRASADPCTNVLNSPKSPASTGYTGDPELQRPRRPLLFLTRGNTGWNPLSWTAFGLP